MRRRLKSLSRPATSSATSMFEAMICSSSRLRAAPAASAAIRLKTLRRGRIALTTSSAPSATQSPTVGKSERASASNRNDPGHVADRSPSARHRARSTVSRWTATTRAGRRPSAANGAKAASQPASQPSGSSAGRTIASTTSADPLQLAGPLGVALGAAERPQPERDEHDAHHDERPDQVGELGHWRSRR